MVTLHICTNILTNYIITCTEVSSLTYMVFRRILSHSTRQTSVNETEVINQLKVYAIALQNKYELFTLN